MRQLRGSIGFILVVVLYGLVPLTTAGQERHPTKDYVRHVVERMGTKAPARSTLRRLHDYDAYIRYFSGLPYIRRHVNLSTNFVRALIAAESGARRSAVSSEGAIGLMQIKPETARRAGRELYASEREFKFVPRRRLRTVTQEDLKDPAVNILIGCYLLDRYNAQFGDDLARTVAAWNAGPRRIRQYGGTPPYRETLELIGRVNAFYRYFQRPGRP